MDTLQQMNKEKAQASSIQASAASAMPLAPTASDGGLQSTHYLNLLERSVRTEEEIKHLRLDFQKMQESMDKRFEQMQHSMDKRFEQMQHNMDKRFEQVDKRFEQVDKRFEDMNERFKDMNERFKEMHKGFRIAYWMIGISLIIISTLIVLLPFWPGWIL